MPLLMVTLLMVQADDGAMRAYRARTTAEPRCAQPVGNEVTVCGRREADRYRITFVTPQARDSVPTERAQLLEPKVAGCGRVGQFFADCGFIGVSMTAGRAGVRVKTRELAP